MPGRLLTAALAIALSGPGLIAQPAPQTQLPRGQMPHLGRPTQQDDALPLFDFDQYFVGAWTFEWLVPESPLGPAGEITGTTVYRAVDGPFYHAETKATGPDGDFTIVHRIAYHRENKILARHVTDSRGFSYMQLGGIGGDLGGFYYVQFDSEPFTLGGHTIRVRDFVRMVSPVNYRVATTISVDGGRFTNFGNPWWRKQFER